MEENNTMNEEVVIINNPSNSNPKNSQTQIVGAIIVAGILIAGAILLKGTSAPTTTGPVANSGGSTSFQMRPVSSDDHILGNINAKIVIVEYSDLECPFCKVFHNTMHQVVEKSNGDVAWVYRQYPIPQLHPKAFHEAEATECAWEQGGNKAFWKYIDKLFEITTANIGFDESRL